jgi:hypothetical protein
MYRQSGGYPPANLLGLAVRRIDQGVLCKYATELVPVGPPSSTSAILESLFISADYDWLQNPVSNEEND